MMGNGRPRVIATVVAVFSMCWVLEGCRQPSPTPANNRVPEPVAAPPNKEVAVPLAEAVAALKQPKPDAAGVTRYLQNGGDPDARSPEGEPLLILADPETGKALLAKGASARAADKDGNTALHMVAKRFFLESYVSGFGDRKTHVTVTITESGSQATTDKAPGSMWRHDDANSALVPLFEYIDVLCAKGADINATNGRGQTALDLAVADLTVGGAAADEIAGTPYVKFLKSKGAKTLYKPKASNQPLTEDQKSFQEFMRAMKATQK